MTTSSNMGLNYVASGEDQYTWATLINDNSDTFSSHDHSYGSGVTINSSSINFLRDFDVGSGFLNVSYLNFLNNSVIITSKNCLCCYNGDLYYTDKNSKTTQITVGSSLNVQGTTGGGFSGDYVSAGAQVYYDSETQTYSHKSSSETAYVESYDLKLNSFDNSGFYINFTDMTYNGSILDLDFNFPSGSTFVGIVTSDSITTTTSTEYSVVEETTSSTTNTYTSLALSSTSNLTVFYVFCDYYTYKTNILTEVDYDTSTLVLTGSVLRQTSLLLSSSSSVTSNYIIPSSFFYSCAPVFYDTYNSGETTCTVQDTISVYLPPYPGGSSVYYVSVDTQLTQNIIPISVCNDAYSSASNSSTAYQGEISLIKMPFYSSSNPFYYDLFFDNMYTWTTK